MAFELIMKKNHSFILLFFFLYLIAPYSLIAQTLPAFSKAEKIEKPGLGNFYKVSETLYRGEQPTAEGFKQLTDLGIKTVVNLRSFNSDRSKIGSLPLSYHHIYAQAWYPEEKDILDFLKIATDPKEQPVFVHCQHGADRTGMMVALYRMVVQGWERQAAIDEMVKGGFGFHSIWKNIIRFMEKVDVEKIKKDLNNS